MAKKKKKEKNIEIEEKPVKKVKKVPLSVYFSIEKIKKHHQAGMEAYKGAKHLQMSLKEWKEFFKDY